MKDKPKQENPASHRTSVKFVRKAGMWCKTSWGSDGKQKQEWFNEKPKQ